MQRSTWDGVIAERQLSVSYPYGIVVAEIAPETLANKVVRFNRLRVVMPDSGIEVDVPRNANLEALPVQQRFDLNSEPFVVYLGIPRRQETRPNAREEGAADQGRPLYSVVLAFA